MLTYRKYQTWREGDVSDLKDNVGGKSACKQTIIVQLNEWSKRGRAMPGEEVSVCGRRGKVMLEPPVEGGAAF